jgi:hypothetical protein
VQTIDTTATPKKTYDDYLAEARKILAKKNDVAPKSYEYYLAQATADIANDPLLKQEAEKIDARNSELHNQGIISSNKTWAEYLAQAQMIIDESKIEGTELYEITRAENSLYDMHIEKGIPMEQLKTPELERLFQNQRLKAIENMGMLSDGRPQIYQPENSLTNKARQDEKMAGYMQESQAIINHNRSQNKVRSYHR